MFFAKLDSRNTAPVVVARSILVLTGGFVLSAMAAPNPEAAVTEYEERISPILEAHCYECHGDGHDKGHVAFDALLSDEEILNPELWLKVLHNTRAGLMPAEQKPRPSSADQQKLERWIKYGVFKIDPRNPDPGRVTVRRLNRVEYRNTVRDLLGADFNSEIEFPPDDTGYGFDNIGDALTVSPMLMEKYVAAAQAIVSEAVLAAPTKPAEQSVPGSAFTGTNAPSKHGKLRLSYYTPATVAAPVKSESAGTYRVILDLAVNGSFDFDPGRCRVVFKIDGQEFLNEEFAYHDEKSFSFESTHQWQAAEHRLSVELQPLGPAVIPGEKKENPLDLVLNKVTIQGPLERHRWVKTASYERFFSKPIPTNRADRRVYARELLGDFAAKAYRRPLTDDTAERLATLAEGIYNQRGKTFEQGVAHAMAAVLASPRFLFRLEEPAPHSVSASIADVDEYSLASRLSYFLWSTMPDAELMNLAARGELRKNISAQVKRMLADPRAENLARNFTGQWLQARDVDGIASNAVAILARDNGEEGELRALRIARMNQDTEAIKKLAHIRDKYAKPKVQLDGDLRWAMRRETEMFFANIIHEDRPVAELIDSDYTFVNENLAKLYGIPDVVGADMRKVSLPAGSPRGGLLTQASSLVVTSNPDRTSPVKRGLFVLVNFLGTPPPPPPANVPALEASERDIEGHEPTLRESLHRHREDPACSSCHNRMDPIGLAFENFNALGMWRETERKQAIHAPGKLITGESFSSVSELKRILANEHRQEFYRTLTDKLLTYAVGRGTEYYDVETIDQIVQRLEHNEGRFSAVLMGVIESAPFQKMRTEATVTVAN
jgi:hypothetical protein